jgi:ankyrin repeat protein
VEVVVFLIAAKADPAMKNAAGQTPADLARGRGHAEVVKVLEK